MSATEIAYAPRHRRAPQPPTDCRMCQKAERWIEAVRRDHTPRRKAVEA